MEFTDKKNFFKVRQTVLEMLIDRKYIIDNSENINFEEFKIKCDNKNINIFINNQEYNKKAYIYFHIDNKSFSKNELKNLMQNLIQNYEDENINLIIILKDKENSAITKELTKDSYKNVEIFLKKNLLFNITHHNYVPKHIILSEEEENDILEKYNTTKSKLPKISKMILLPNIME